MTGTSAANALAREADVVIGIGTRYSDFTTASHTIFANPDVRFVNVNTLGFDAAKHSATMLVADAREALRRLIQVHFEVLLGPGNDFVPVMLYEHRALSQAERATLAQLQVRYESVWTPVLQALQHFCR